MHINLKKSHELRRRASKTDIAEEVVNHPTGLEHRPFSHGRSGRQHRLAGDGLKWQAMEFGFYP